MSNRRNGFSSAIGLAALSLTLLALGSCASADNVTELAFGTEAEIGSLTVSSIKTGEGELLVIISSTAPEDLDVDVRMGDPVIGFDYSDTKRSGKRELRSKFSVEGGRTVLRSDWTREFPIFLTNAHNVNREFKTRITIIIRGMNLKWRIEIPVSDEMMFADVRFLRQQNKTNYWNPKQIETNWEKYLYHIGN